MFELLLGVLIQPCPTDEVPEPETYSVCYWDADTQGNGDGHSFVSIVVPEIDVYVFIRV